MTETLGKQIDSRVFWILVLADDLTGALEAGAKFAERGFNVRVTTGLCLHRPQVDVLVVDTETRHLSESDAYDTTYRIALESSQFEPILVYKKTDSTLRGNIAAEFRAMQTAFPARSLVYAPAYVEMGRTVRHGRLYVNGILLHETEFCNDRLNPVHESNIRALLNNDSILVVDAESTQEMRTALGSLWGTDSLAAGPASVAQALAEFRELGSNPQKSLPRLHRCLIVNGSQHPASREQMAFARQEGCFSKGWEAFDEPVEATGLEWARQVGERVKRRLESSSYDAIFVLGGDTTFGIHAALHAPDFLPWCEVLPGVPLSSGGGFFWITKAGGFGTTDMLCRVRDLLGG